MSRLVSFLLLAAIVIVVAVIFIWVMAGFLLPLFLALVLVVMFRPFHTWLTTQLGGRERIAAAITTSCILLSVLLPMVLLLMRAASDGLALAERTDQRELLDGIERMRVGLNLDLPSPNVRNEVEHLADQIAELRGADHDPPDEESESERVAPNGAPQDADLNASRDTVLAELPKTIRRLHTRIQMDWTARHRPDPERKSKDNLRLANILNSLDQISERVEEVTERAKALVVAETSPDESVSAPIPSNAQELTLNYVDAVQDLQAAYDHFHVQLFGNAVRYWLKLQVNPDADRKRLDSLRETLKAWAGPMALSTTQVVGSFVGRFAVGFAVLIISLYYFLADGSRMIATVMRLSPLAERYERQMFIEFDKVCRAVVVATLLSAAVQAMLAGFGYYMAGIEAVILLSVLTFFLAMVPFVGAAAVWGGCSLWVFFHEGRTLAAALLALYGVAVVSMADNVIKPFILHGQSNIHPLLALLSVLGGVSALGPIGIFVGPMAVAFLHALLHMLQTEISELSEPSRPELVKSLD